MSPPRALLAACALLGCLSLTSCRVLQQTGTDTATPNFSVANGTYLSSVTVIDEGATAASAAACSALCAADENCMFYSWCPTTETAGCSVPGFNGAAATTVAASGCVLSYDADTERNAVLAMSGETVPFVGGRYNPTNAAPTANTSDPASWIDPAGIPAECNGWFTGDQWAGDEIECHVCNGDYQLKCDLDSDIIGDDSVKCEFDSAGLGSLVNNAYEFSCVVDFTKTPQNQCNWEDIAAKVPTCAVEPVRRIMATWKPDE